MRVLLVDDHPAIRLGMKSLLDLTDDIQVVGEAKDADGAMRLVSRQGVQWTLWCPDGDR